jgi:DNA/RNA endonuclease YhcR with UshA esterase domain
MVSRIIGGLRLLSRCRKRIKIAFGQGKGKAMPETNQPAPTLPEYPPETLCQSCGKFVGAYARCPYCGATHHRRLSIRFIRIFALVVGIGGVFLIWLAARGIKAPVMKVQEIGPTNSFAYIRIEGNTTNARIYDDGGVSFTVDDGTGTIGVRAYREVGKGLQNSGRVPSPGDEVAAEGTINLRGDSIQMIVNSTEKVWVKRVTPEAVPIINLDDSYLEQKVMIEGRIVAARTFNKGSSVTLSDGTGSIDIVIWDTNRKMLGDKEQLLTEGRTVRIQGKVGKYRDKPQLELAFPSDIQEVSQ